MLSVNKYTITYDKLENMKLVKVFLIYLFAHKKCNYKIKLMNLVNIY